MEEWWIGMEDAKYRKLSAYRPTIAEINLAAFRQNISSMRQLLSPGCRLMAVLKTNAYGHGIIPLAHEAVKAGVERLAVTMVEEGAELRRSGIHVPIHVLSGLTPEQADDVVEYELTSAISSIGFAEQLSKAAMKHNKTIPVHLKIDTGLHRFGVTPEQAIHFCKQVFHLPKLYWEGIYTHFSCADEGNWDVTQQQFEQFSATIKNLLARGFHFSMQHAGASTIAIERPDMHLDFVRAGISLFGFYPAERQQNLVKLLPVMSLKSTIIQLRDVPADTRVGYGSQHYTNKMTKVATIPIGLGDGYRRILSDRAEVLINGTRARIIGSVSLDQILVDVTHIPNVKEADEVVLLGRQGDDEITAGELARIMQSIADEVVAGLAARVPRIYRNGQGESGT